MVQILDHNGQPIDTGRLAEPQTAQVAQLWREFANHPARGLTPTRLREILVQGEMGDLRAQLDLADDMEECDPHLAAELSKRKLFISGLAFRIVPPANASAAEKAQAEMVGEWFGALPDFEDVLLAMMDAVLKGFHAHEVEWPLVERVRLPVLTSRPQRWFTVDGTHDGLLLRDPEHTHVGVAPGQPFVNPAHLPRPTVQGQPLVAGAWLVHRHRARNGYLARSALLRVLAWPYLYKAYAWRDFAEFLEIYGLPMRVGKYPVSASDEEKLALLRAVTQLGHNAAGIMPQGMALEMLNAAQGAKDPFEGMLAYCNAAESKAILGQTLTAGEGQHGTQALGNVHNEVRHDIGTADARQVAGTITTQLVRLMALLNIPGADPRRLPRFEFDLEEAEDLAAYADNLPKLAKAGMGIPQSWVHQKLGIPKAVDGEAVLTAAEPAPVVPPAPAPPKPGSAAALVGLLAQLGQLAGRVPAAAPAPQPAPDLIDALVAEQAAQWQAQLGPMVLPLLAEADKAVAAGETLEQFAARLPDLVQLMDAGPATEAVARSGLQARLAGEADLDLGPVD